MCIFHQPYSWIPLVFMSVPAILLISLIKNWPIIGLIATMIESDHRLRVSVLNTQYKIDTVLYVNGYKESLRVLHVRKTKDGYKTWAKLYSKRIQVGNKEGIQL